MEIDKLLYLKRLPENACYEGDYKKGEIELVGSDKLIEKIIEGRRRKLKKIKLPDTSKEIGIVFEDEYILIVRDPVIFPSGSLGTYLRIFERPALDGPVGVVILPVCGDLIYLRRIFRHATRQWEIECARGYREKGLTPHQAVIQEINEEIGLPIKEIRKIGNICVNSGILAGEVLIYWVELYPGNVKPNQEDTEAFGDFIIVKSGLLFEMIRSGVIRDSFTLSALQQAQANNLLYLAN